MDVEAEIRKIRSAIEATLLEFEGRAKCSSCGAGRETRILSVTAVHLGSEGMGYKANLYSPPNPGWKTVVETVDGEEGPPIVKQVCPQCQPRT